MITELKDSKGKPKKHTTGFSQMQNSTAGFTLIELLVVIAIIGLLSSVVLASLNSARAKARDANRFSDIKQIQIALELYYDENGGYPNYDSGSPTCSDGWAINHVSFINCWNDLKSKLSPYLSTLPVEPLSTYPDTSYNEYHYQSRNNGQGYFVMVDLEGNKPADDGCYGVPWYCVGVNWQE